MLFFCPSLNYLIEYIKFQYWEHGENLVSLECLVLEHNSVLGEN